MRAEPSFERVQLLRPAPASDGPALRRASPAAYEDAIAGEEKGSGGSFVRLAVFLVAMCVFGVGLAVAWRVVGGSGARLWPAFASQPGPAAAANDSATQLDRMAKELDALKASFGELTAAQREMATTLATMQEEAKRRAAADASQSPASAPAASARSSAYSNALSANPTAATPSRSIPAARLAPPPTSSPAPQVARPPAAASTASPLIRP